MTTNNKAKRRAGASSAALLMSLLLPTVAAHAENLNSADASSARPAEENASTSADDIVVTGNTTRRLVGDAVQEVQPASRTTFTKGQLEKIVGLDSAVTGALKYFPGVHFGGGDNSGITEGKFTIRGFIGDQIGFSRDGVPLNDPEYLTPHADFFGDPENYGSVEVIYGGSALDTPSFTASGGAVAITSVAPTKDPGLLAKQSLGSYGLRRTFGRVNTGEWGGFSAWISASRTNGHLWTQGGGQLYSRRFEGDLRYDWSDGSYINLVASDFKMKTNSYLNPTLAQYRSEPYDAGLPDVAFATRGGTNGVADILPVTGSSAQLSRADFAIQTYGVTSLFNLASNVRLRINPYYVRVANGVAAVGATSLPEGLLGVDTSGDGDKLDIRPLGIGVFPTQHRLGGTAQLQIDLTSNNSFEIGGWYDHVRARNELLLEPINADGTPASSDGIIRIRDADGNPIDLTNQRNLIITEKVWAQDRWIFLPGWTAALAGTYLHSKLDGTNVAGILSGTAFSRSASYGRFLPSFSLQWQPDSHNQLYYDTNINFRIPAVASVYALTPVAKQKAETNWNQELGYRLTTSNLLVNAALFYDKFKNRQVSYALNAGVTSYFNAGDVTTKGIELSINGKLPHHLIYGASYSHIIGRQDGNYSAGGLTAPTKGKQLFDTPKNLLTGSFGFDSGRFYGTALVRYTGSFYGDLSNSEKVPDYTVVDLNGGIRFGNLIDQVHEFTIAANVNNLFNKKYLAGVYAGSVNAEPNGNFYAAPTYDRGVPRTFLLTLSVGI